MDNGKFHICFLGDASTIHTAKIASFFKNRGYKVTVVSFSAGTIDGVDTRFIDCGVLAKSKLKYIVGLPKAKRIVRDLKPDILHAIYATSYGFVGACSGYHPFLISGLGSDIVIQPKNSLAMKWLVKSSLRKADAIHSQSMYLTEEMVKLGVEKERILTLTYGVDASLLDLKKEEVSPKKGIIVTSTRNLDPLYNVSLLIDAIPSVLSKDADIKFIIIGSGKEEEKLKQKTRKLNIEHAVEFLGKVSNREVKDVLRRTDVYISTSLSDGQSISLLEAMAIGAFPIVTDIAPNREWIENGRNGFLCSVIDPDDLAEKILRSSQDLSLRATAVKINKQIIERKGLFQKNMEAMEQRYYLLKK